MALNIHQRQKGPKILGLDSLVPSDSRFDRLMSYRYYRLIDTTAARTQDSTTRLHRLLKNIQLTMREHKFDGEDPILIFDFLSRAVEEADTLAMNEGQLVICLPHLLTKTAAQRYRSIASRSRDGKMTRCPEAVQYLLRTYGTDRCIQEAVEYFEGLRQATNENEDAFAARVSSAAYRCGNVHAENERINVFVNGLHSAIRTIVSRFRRSQPRSSVTFDLIVSFARDEGDAYRDRTPASRVNVTPVISRVAAAKYSPPKPRTRQHVQFAEADVETIPPSSSPAHFSEDLLLADLEAPSTISTSELPSTVADEPVLAMPECRRTPSPMPRVQPTPVPFDTNPRPGWGVRTGLPPICYKCYDEGHYSNECRVSIEDYAMIVENFQKLTPERQTRVPPDNYKLACRLADPSKVDQAIVGSLNEPKN